MRLPKHKNPTQQIAVAPYNFVPLPESVVTVEPESLPDQGIYHEQRHTGYIECMLTTESPTYVRCPLTPEEFLQHERGEDSNKPFREQVKNAPDFFYTDLARTPRIPGSSLRGMLRSLVEIAGHGKMEYVSDQRLVYRAVGDTTSHGEEYRSRIMRFDGEGRNQAGKPCRQYTPLVRAGYIEQDSHGDWYIRPAQAINGTTFARIRIADIPRNLQRIPGCKNAERIYIQPGPYQYQDVRGGFIRVRFSKVLRSADAPGAGLVEGALARSGHMASKRTEAVVFPPDLAADPIPISDELTRAYRDQVSKEQGELLGGKEGVLRKGQPVFYLMENRQLVFLGHTMMMRLPYRKSPRDLVPEVLRQPAQVDLAEAIFGYTKETGEGKARAYASRIFVGDAVLESGQQNVWLKPDKPLIPKILGSPKPTTFQHYLVQRSSDPREIGRTRGGQPKLLKQLADYATATPDETVLRGHKLYWHKGNVMAAEIQEILDRLRDEHGREPEHDTQHTQFKPVAAGVRFRFCIHFENLADEELGALLWVLQLPGESGRQYRHSLGMGKPYGMGAVRLKPTVYLSQRQERYASLFNDQGQWTIAVQPASQDQVSGYVASFDRFVRHRIGAEDLNSLAAVERIRMLLKMLEWPGPQPHQKLTRYLEIEHPDPSVKRGKINEYRDRPVLSDPLHVERSQLPEKERGQPSRTGPPPTKSARADATPRSESLPAEQAVEGFTRSSQTAVSVSVPPSPTVSELSHPASAAEVKSGMYLEGHVLRVESNRIVVDICGEEATLMLDRVVPLVRDVYDQRERFPPGKVIQAWVKGRNKAGRIQLTMQRP